MSMIAAGALLPREIATLLLALAVLLGVARLLGEICRRFGQPAVLGEIMAGVLLGATVLGNPMIAGEQGWNVQLYDFLFPSYLTEATAHPDAAAVALDTTEGHEVAEAAEASEAAEATLAASGTAEAPVEKKVHKDKRVLQDPILYGLETYLMLAVTFLLLTAGLEVDLSVVTRQGKAALLVSLLGMVVPFALGFALAYSLPYVLGFDPEYEGSKLPFALFVGIAMSITALPVIAKVLMDLNMLRSDVGMLVMSSAMVNDLLGWIGFAMVLAMIAPDAGDGLPLPWIIGLTLGFVTFMLTVGRWMMSRGVLYVQAHASWPGGILAFILVVGLLCAAFTEWIGIHAIFGAFLAGVAIGDSKHLRQRTRETVEQFVNNIFAPVFFAGIALRVNFVETFDLAAVLLVLGVAIAGKLVGCYYGARWAKLAKRESWAIGFGMTARGAMEIILGQIALSFGLITDKLFVAIVVMAIVTSMLAGPAMQRALGRKQKRSLSDLIPAKGFVGRLKAIERSEAIREMSYTAADVLGCDAEELNRRCWEREETMSTGIGHGIAVPHARLSEVDRPMVFLATAPTGIDFDAADNQPAEIICLILSPEHDGTTQIEALDAVARAFLNEDTRRAVVDAQTLTEVRAALASTAKSDHGHG